MISRVSKDSTDLERQIDAIFQGPLPGKKGVILVFTKTAALKQGIFNIVRHLDTMKQAALDQKLHCEHKALTFTGGALVLVGTALLAPVASGFRVVVGIRAGRSAGATGIDYYASRKYGEVVALAKRAHTGLKTVEKSVHELNKQLLVQDLRRQYIQDAAGAAAAAAVCCVSTSVSEKHPAFSQSSQTSGGAAMQRS